MAFEEAENDHFDRLPEALLPLIFNKVEDARSLSRCLLVCKRFASVVPEVGSVSLAVPRKSRRAGAEKFRDQVSKSNCGSRNRLKSLIRKVVTRPLQFLLHLIPLKSSSSPEVDCFYHSPIEILKNFKEIQSLQIELPGHGGEIGPKGGDSFLRWRAEFGSRLESCVILGANSFRRSSENPSNCKRNHQAPAPPPPDENSLLTDSELKLRVVWTISCLIAASARHYLLQQLASEHLMLRSAVVTDGSKQGRLCMNREQIENFRSNSHSSERSGSSPPLERVQVPAVKMKLWYVPMMELPASECVMEGVTLVVIKPVDGAKTAESDVNLVRRVFSGGENVEEEEVFGEAVKEVMKKNNLYTLEMKSF